MTDEKRLILKAISILLLYPDESLADSLDSVDEAMKEGTGTVGGLHPFMTYLRETPLMKLREEYTRSFDLDSNLCLSVTYHRWGDDRKRGEALAQLMQIYKSAGYETMTSELPDHLPLMLEFLSISPAPVGSLIVNEYMPQIETLGSRLTEAGSPYAALFEVMIDSLKTA